MTYSFRHRFLIQLAAITLIASCAPGMAPFSQRAYQYATELKVDAIKLMDRAALPYSESDKQVEKLLTDIEKAYEYAKGRPRNDHSTRQWALIVNPEMNLLGGFLERWKQQGALSYPFISESKGIVADAFDAVIGLESGKIRYDN